MSTARQTRTRAVAAAGLAAFLAASLTACGSSSDGGTAAPSTSAGGASTEKAGTSTAAVDVFTKKLDAYPVPTEAAGDVSGVKGKTIYYIPISQQAPQFTVTAKALTEAAGKVGMKVQVCDGKGTPTDISSCIDQGTQAKAAAIIADAIPYVLASNSFDAAQAAKIPVIVGNNYPSDGKPASATLSYIGENAGTNMEEALATWVTADSGGKAHILINASTDGPSPVIFRKAGQKVYDDTCPDCKVTENKVSSANFALVPSSTSSALLKDPSINYVETQYEQFLQATETGIKQTSRTGIKVIDGAAQISSLKAVKAGTLEAATGQASAYIGWVFVDAALRMNAGTAVPDYTIPIRLFTKENIGDVALTEDAQNSGEWFGPTTYTSEFEKLWGAA